MGADLDEPLARDPAAAGDVLQEGDDVVRALGAAEGDEEEGVVRAAGAGEGHVVILPTDSSARTPGR
jgi:hypothetical protein